MTESPEDPEPGRRAEEEIEVVSATATSHSLVFLDKFTQYRIQVCTLPTYFSAKTANQLLNQQ